MTVFRVRPGNALLKPSGDGSENLPFPPDVSCSRSAGGRRRRRSSDRRKRLPRGGGTKSSCLCKIPLPVPGRIRFAPASFYIYSRTSSTGAGRRGAGGVPGLAMIGCTAETGEVRKTVSKSIGGWATDGFKGMPHRLADCPPGERNADP